MYVILRFSTLNKTREFLYHIDSSDPFWGYITANYPKKRIAIFGVFTKADKRLYYLLNSFPSFKEYYLLEGQDIFKVLVTAIPVDN